MCVEAVCFGFAFGFHSPGVIASTFFFMSIVKVVIDALWIKIGGNEIPAKFKCIVGRRGQV